MNFISLAYFDPYKTFSGGTENFCNYAKVSFGDLQK